MIKALQTTGFCVLILGVVFTASPGYSASDSDDDVEKFLNSPSIIDQFKEQAKNRREKSTEEVSPLVKEAEKFGVYLNPPKKSKPTPSRISRSTALNMPKARPKGPVSSKFKVIGTSYFAKRPSMSFALIDEPGKGYHWIKQSDKVGHLIIQQIRDGVIVIRDGTRTYEQEAERAIVKSLVKGQNTAPAQTDLERVLSTDVRGDTPGDESKSIPKPSMAAEPGASEPALGPGVDKTAQLLAELKQLREDMKAGKGDPSVQPNEAGMAMMESLISGLEASTKVKPEEAKKIDELGKELDEEVSDDPDQRSAPKVEKNIKPSQRPQKRPRPRRPIKEEEEEDK